MNHVDLETVGRTSFLHSMFLVLPVWKAFLRPSTICAASLAPCSGTEEEKTTHSRDFVDRSVL